MTDIPLDQSVAALLRKSSEEPRVQMKDMQELICHLLWKNHQLRMELSASKTMNHSQNA